MKSFIVIFLFFIQIYQPCAREPLLTDIVDKDISITASFDGAKIIIYGTVDPKLYKDSIIIINVLGPSSHLKIRKKEKYAGIWLVGKNEMIFTNAPGYFASSSNLDNLKSIDKSILKELNIGWNNLIISTNNFKNDEEVEPYKKILKSYYQNRGLYQIASNIDILGESLFRAEFVLPAITPTGTYNVKSFLLNHNGKLISSWANSVKVSKEGLAEGLSDYSIEHPLLYGLLAALGAIIAGYIGSEVFRRI
ncbi:MAG: TIGR02186 family protein [Alphaproteobacteria bacterium]|nr:TIGR02186 family protein [Alphaproteobacteria bacterium]